VLNRKLITFNSRTNHSLKVNINYNEVLQDNIHFIDFSKLTTLSKKEANNISNLRVEILIEDGVKEKSLNKINAYLYNGKKRIINENIKIQLNGKPLELFVRTGNYYDKFIGQMI